MEIEGPETVRLSGFGLYTGMSVTVRQTFPTFVIKTEETEIALETGVADRIRVTPTRRSAHSGRNRFRRRAGTSGSEAVQAERNASRERTPARGDTTVSLPSPPPFESEGFPRRTFTVAVALLCGALTISALHAFFTLRNLRTEYLENRGHDIVALIDGQLRGPGRRFDLENRQRVLDSALESYSESVLFLALLDRSGQITAQAGTPRSGAGVFVFEAPLGGQRGPRWSSSSNGPERLQIGLRTDQADFISGQAYIHLGISLATVLMLAALAVYFLRTLDRYLALQARDASERQLAQLGRLSATLAHEIRNPLGAMKGLTQLVQEDLPQQHRAHELMSTVISEAERLEKLVTDLLAFARPRSLSTQTVAIRELVESTAGLLEPRAAEKGIEIRVSGPPGPLEALADSDGLRQVLLNVLGNALDASGGPGAVEVTLTEQGPMMEIAVSDRGSGLGEENPEDFFQPFRTTKTQGSGLGLAVSRQIVEALGGRISLENRPGGGAICRIRLRDAR